MMKTKITNIKRLLLMLTCILLAKGGWSQTSVAVLLTGDAQVSPTEYQFDIYLQSSGPGTFELSTHSYGIFFNPAIKNGGTLSVAWVAGSTTLTNAAQQNLLNAASVNATSNQIRIAASCPASAA